MGQYGALYGSDYHRTINDNMMVVIMIERRLALIMPRRSQRCRGRRDLCRQHGPWEFFRFKQGDAGYEAMVRRIHDVTLQHKIALGGPQAWTGRPGFTFFQAPSDTQIIRLGAQVNLGTAPGSKWDKPGIAPVEGVEKK